MLQKTETVVSNMKYLICQDWENTSNNHAGMKYMSNLLKKNFPDEYEVFVFADKIGNGKGTLLNKLKRETIVKVINPLLFVSFAIYLSLKLKKGDKVYLLEYMEPLSPQNYVAKIIKKFHPRIHISALIHLTPQVIESRFSSSEIKKWLFPVDKILTFGTSLTNYFIQQSTPSNKIDTLFHYVDTDYYSKKAGKEIANERKINVIAMGNQKRNYKILCEIVKNNPDVNFTICKGVSDIDHLFAPFKNVNMVGFVPEDELKQLMNEADISLNVMDDTVGSNVVTTSLAMGLAMVVSDVGSIRDYCDDGNAIFCQNEEINLFGNAIKLISSDPLILRKMQSDSIAKSKNFTIEKFHFLLNQPI